MDLREKVVLITGGTRMGSAVAQAFADKGCRVVLTWRRSRPCRGRRRSTIGEAGAHGAFIRCDLLSRSMIQQVVRKIRKRFHRLDVVVNLASIYGPAPLQKGIPLAPGMKTFRPTPRAPTCYPLPLRTKCGAQAAGGSFISPIGPAPAEDLATRFRSYYVSKTAVKAGCGGPRARALSGHPRQRHRAGSHFASALLSRKEYQAVIRPRPASLGGAEEIAKAVVFLSETDFVTGETLRVDGGRHLY